MSRYIDADRVHRDCEMRFADTGVPYEWAYALTIIDHAPTADVAPVVHGRWIALHDEFCACSICKYPVYVGWNQTNYCPNCGATMDEECK